MPFRFAAVVVALMVAVVGSTQTAVLTGADLVRLHRSGVGGKLLVELIGQAAAVEPLSAGQESVLVAAGLPPEVVDAYRERSPGPDDERLGEIVALANAGVDTDLIVTAVQRLDPPLSPSARDIEFLTRSQAPRAVVYAVMAASLGSQPGGEPHADASRSEPVPGSQVFSPLRCMYRTAIAMVAREAVGRLELDGNMLRFTGHANGACNVELNVQMLQRVWLDCSPGPACYELGIQPAHGDTIRLRDDDWRSDGNDLILVLFEALRARNPDIEYRTNVGE